MSTPKQVMKRTSLMDSNQDMAINVSIDSESADIEDAFTFKQQILEASVADDTSEPSLGEDMVDEDLYGNDEKFILDASMLNSDDVSPSNIEGKSVQKLKVKKKDPKGTLCTAVNTKHSELDMVSETKRKASVSHTGGDMGKEVGKCVESEGGLRADWCQTTLQANSPGSIAMAQFSTSKFQVSNHSMHDNSADELEPEVKMQGLQVSQPSGHQTTAQQQVTPSVQEGFTAKLEQVQNRIQMAHKKKSILVTATHAHNAKFAKKLVEKPVEISGSSDYEVCYWNGGVNHNPKMETPHTLLDGCLQGRIGGKECTVSNL
ncbi:hypothetical protein BDN71DRAFT_1552677 [Pleurotus eryngii]|uniref:Uncharacterized protein n=1 Tax=Pleurotus eryngii TaxID=5323 RepID=A0A9P6D9H2_PLEER|nr:hypothetical protein BDN71DRAFT_1552677 [Pleurotus eryngii]